MKLIFVIIRLSLVILKCSEFEKTASKLSKTALPHLSEVSAKNLTQSVL